MFNNNFDFENFEDVQEVLTPRKIIKRINICPLYLLYLYHSIKSKSII